MAQSKHTPGRWYTEASDMQQIYVSGANAQLIAAACLLKSLKAILPAFISATGAGGKIEGDDEIITEAKRVIALVEGN